MDHEHRGYKKLEAFEIWTLRRVEKISWTEDKIMNGKVLVMIGEKEP